MLSGEALPRRHPPNSSLKDETHMQYIAQTAQPTLLGELMTVALLNNKMNTTRSTRIAKSVPASSEHVFNQPASTCAHSFQIPTYKATQPQLAGPLDQTAPVILICAGSELPETTFSCQLLSHAVEDLWQANWLAIASPGRCPMPDNELGHQPSQIR